MALALWRRGGSAALRLLAWIPAVRARAASFAELQDAMFRLVGPWPLLVGTALSVAAWFAECVAFQVVLAGAGVEFALGGSVFVYSLGTIAGAVSMLPGGLVATEAGMVAMVVELFRAAPREAGVTAVLVVRLATLWFAVAVGLLALGWMRGRLAARALTAGDEKG
jgi:uncharacterized protein (TIRG00374 family)